jgi:hypothetical protein
MGTGGGRQFGGVVISVSIWRVSMRRVAVMAFAAASLFAASSVWADQTPAPSDPAAPAPAPDAKPAKPKSKMDDPDRIVCTREHVVGSNRPQKICMTVAERQRLKDIADQTTDLSKNNISIRTQGTDGTN